MQTKTKAIVLRTLKYGEQSLIVDMLTEQSGRTAFIVRIPKTQKGGLKKQLFQPLTLLEIVFDNRQSARLLHLREARIAHPFTSIPFDPSKLAVALFLAEFLYYCTRDELRNIPLFQYVENSITWLDASQRSFANFHLVFMMRFTLFTGFYPNLDDFTPGCCFDLRSAGFAAVAPLHPDVLCPDDASRIVTLMRMDYESMHVFRLNRDERNRITETLLAYYRLHIPAMPELHSFAVMRELFV